MIAGLRSRRGAYTAIGVLTLVWGFNWIAMKLALANADPVTFNLQRTWRWRSIECQFAVGEIAHEE